MATSLFIRKGAKKETVYLSCRAYYTNKTTKEVVVNLTTATKIAVNRAEWEKGHDGTAKHMEAWLSSDAGKSIKDIEERIRKAVDDYVYIQKGKDGDRIKRIIEDIVTPTIEDMPTTLVGFCERYVEECTNGARLAENGHNKGKMKTEGTIKTYKYFINKIRAYEKERNITVALGDVNTSFMTDFRAWLVSSGLKTNAVAGYNKILHVFLCAAEKKGLVDLRAIDVPSIGIVAPDTVYLTQERLDTLWSMDFGDDVLNKIRDTFLIGCETGQRYSDYRRITMDDVVKMKDGTECIKVVQKKTGTELFIPLTDRVRTILERNKGKRAYCIDKFNRGVKDICKQAGFLEMVEVTSSYGLKRETIKVPFYELVSSHTARRTLATLMYMAGCPLADIMAITGHKEESTLRKYLRITNEEKGMAVAKTDYFMKRRAAI